MPFRLHFLSTTVQEVGNNGGPIQVSQHLQYDIAVKYGTFQGALNWVFKTPIVVILSGIVVEIADGLAPSNCSYGCCFLKCSYLIETQFARHKTNIFVKNQILNYLFVAHETYDGNYVFADRKNRI